MKYIDKIIRIKNNIIEYKQHTMAAYLANILLDEQVSDNHIKDLELLVLNSLDYNVIKDYYNSVKRIILKEKFENYFLFR